MGHGAALRGCSIWPSWHKSAAGNTSKLLPRRLACDTAVPLWLVSKGLHSIDTAEFSPKCCHSLSLLPSSSFHFIWGKGHMKKRSSILAEVLIILNIQLWTIDPTSWSQWWDHPAGSWAVLELFPELGSWQSLPFRTLMPGRGFPLLPDTSPSLTSDRRPCSIFSNRMTLSNWELEEKKN